jgi:hypothetical protein
MVNLKSLEDRLNADIKLRQEFLSDPTSVLRREGFILSFEQECRIRMAVTRARPLMAGKQIIIDFMMSANQQ